MKRISLLVIAAAVSSAFTGCGGGGGGGGGTGDQTPPPPATTTLTGVASSGPLKKATVSAYCGKTETSPIGTASTADGSGGTTPGAFTLTITTCSLPVKLVVTPKTDGSTQLLDEIRGALTPPPTFRMAAYISNTGTTTSKNITPFTDMAAVVADQAPTVSASVVLNAENAIVTTVLGGNSAAYGATPKLLVTSADFAAATAAERQLATLRTAVSAVAQSGACSSATTDADKIACAISTLENQAKSLIPSVSDGGATLPPTLPANTPATTLRDALAGLPPSAPVAPEILSDTAGAGALLDGGQAAAQRLADAGGTFPPPTSVTGIQAAKALLTNVRTDIMSLTNDADSGFLDGKFAAMQADFTANGRVNGLTQNVMATDGGILLLQSSLPFFLGKKTSSPDVGMTCTVFQTTSNKATCTYNVVEGGVPTAHTLVVTQTSGTGGAGDTNYSWVDTAGGVQKTGLVTQTRNTAGDPTALSIVGAFNGAANEAITVSLTGSETAPDAAGNVTLSVTGHMEAATGGVTHATYILGATTITFRNDTASSAGAFLSMTSNVSLATAAFKYEGELTLDTPKTDPAGDTIPTHIKFVGIVSDVSGAAVSEFMRGTLEASMSNFDTFNGSLPRTASNFEQGSASFVGKVSSKDANGTTVFDTTVTMSRTVLDQVDWTFAYSKNGGQIISGTLTHHVGSSATNGSTATLQDASGISIVLSKPQDQSLTGSVKDGSTVIGTISGHNQVTFIDGTTVFLI